MLSSKKSLFFDQNNTVFRSRHRALQKQYPVFRPDIDYFQVADCLTDRTVVTGHLFTWKYPGRIGGRANGAGASMSSVPVTGRSTGKAMSFHDPGKTSSLGGTGDVYLLTDLEDIQVNFLAYLVFIYFIGQKFPQ